MPDPYPVRKPMRLRKYNYSQQGSYFLTICSRNKEHLFGHIGGFSVSGEPQRVMSRTGLAVERCIAAIPAHYPNVTLENFVVMPNHVHLLLTVERAGSVTGDTMCDVLESLRPMELVPRIVSALKRFTNKEMGERLWQSGYMDHVIRNWHDFEEHWNYIEHNPFRWAEDPYYKCESRLENWIFAE